MKAANWVPNQKPSSMTAIIKEMAETDGNSTSYSTNGIKAKARIRMKQDVDLLLKNLKLEKHVPLHREVYQKQTLYSKTANRRGSHYCQRWHTVPEFLQINGYSQMVPNTYTKETC